MLRESSWFSQAAKTDRPRSSRRCSCGIDVVGIVGPRAVVAERPDGLAGDAPCLRARGSVPSGAARHASADVSMIASRHRPRAAVFVRHGGPRLDRERLAADRGEVVLGDVVAEAWKNFVEMTSAPLAISGFDGGSNLMK